jgi:hypothetical protein
MKYAIACILVSLVAAGCGRTGSQQPAEPVGTGGGKAELQEPAAPVVKGEPTFLEAAVSRAKSGDVITLPEGTFPAGVKLPDGVSLRGAGFRKTILDARKAEVGLTINGGSGAEVADLTITGASRTNLVVKGASGVAVRRVRTTGSINGIQFTDVAKGRIENVVSDDNRYGILVGGGSDNVVVNCTLARNAGIGLSLASGTRPLAFNNCVVDGSTGVYIGEAVVGPKLDHNLYFTLFTGKMGGQIGRRALGDWKYLTGLDTRSVQMPVKFQGPESGDYRPSGPLGWSLERAVTSDWGIAALGGVDAPARDIDGQARVGRPDLGAFEIALTPPRPADGVVKVHSGAGVTSAGVFDPQGYEVEYLFQNMPMEAGEYPFWLSTRGFLGRPIAPGSYEVRSVESDLRWEYLGWVGDTGEAYPPGKTASVAPSHLAFDRAGHLLVGQGWSEDTTNVRGYDVTTGKVAWTFGGSLMMFGLTLDSDGTALILRDGGANKGELTRIDPKNGALVPLPGQPTGRALIDRGDAAGIAELDGKIYLADRSANKLRFGPADGSRWDGAIDVPAPSSPTADAKTKVIWVISAGQKVLAISPVGKILQDRDFSKYGPAALSANNGRLAIATRVDGKVHILELPDPRVRATSERAVGRGDGPFGPFLPDRFLFQRAESQPDGPAAVALGPGGELAVADHGRVLVFDAQGKPTWNTFGVFGNGTAPSFADPGRVFDTGGRRTLLLETGADGSGTWRPGTHYDMPAFGESQFLGDFAEGSQVFGVVVARKPGQQGGELQVLRFDGDRARQVLRIARDPKRDNAYFTYRDTNGDGAIDARDGVGTALPGADGNPFRNDLLARFNILQPNGDILILDSDPDHWATLWRRSREADGSPAYRAGDRLRVPRPREDLISPYTHKPDATRGLYGATLDPDGLIANINLQSSPDGTGFLNSAGTDLAGFDRKGKLRWLHRLDTDGALAGLASVGPVVLAGVATTCEILAVNHDGLGLGSFGQPAQVHHPGFFLDHPEAVQAYKGRDGRTYALIADNYDGRHHWYRLDAADRIKAHVVPVNLGQSAASALAALPAPTPYVPSKPAPPLVRIPRLAAPLAIDGDLAKWRKAGIVPQVVITTDTTGGGKFDGPRDCSAVVRLAYHGQDLYGQFLVFDDNVSFHQDVAKHHLQDGAEICINGYLAGFKFDLTTTSDTGPTILRNRFFQQKLTWALPAAHAPRSIRVLDDARSVEERGLIESAYGLDMSGCRVLVAEFKLPIDATTYKDSLKELEALTPWGPGREFWLGFLINDNDEPGTDVQNYLKWPATYDNFGPVELGARAVLE